LPAGKPATSFLGKSRGKSAQAQSGTYSKIQNMKNLNSILVTIIILTALAPNSKNLEYKGLAGHLKIALQSQSAV